MVRLDDLKVWYDAFDTGDLADARRKPIALLFMPDGAVDRHGPVVHVKMDVPHLRRHRSIFEGAVEPLGQQPITERVPLIARTPGA